MIIFSGSTLVISDVVGKVERQVLVGLVRRRVALWQLQLVQRQIIEPERKPNLKSL